MGQISIEVRGGTKACLQTDECLIYTRFLQHLAQAPYNHVFKQRIEGIKDIVRYSIKGREVHISCKGCRIDPEARSKPQIKLTSHTSFSQNHQNNQ